MTDARKRDEQEVPRPTPPEIIDEPERKATARERPVRGHQRRRPSCDGVGAWGHRPCAGTVRTRHGSQRQLNHGALTGSRRGKWKGCRCSWAKAGWWSRC